MRAIGSLAILLSLLLGCQPKQVDCNKEERRQFQLYLEKMSQTTMDSERAQYTQSYLRSGFWHPRGSGPSLTDTNLPEVVRNEVLWGSPTAAVWACYYQSLLLQTDWTVANLDHISRGLDGGRGLVQNDKVKFPLVTHSDYANAVIYLLTGRRFGSSDEYRQWRQKNHIKWDPGQRKFVAATVSSRVAM